MFGSSLTGCVSRAEAQGQPLQRMVSFCVIVGRCYTWLPPPEPSAPEPTRNETCKGPDYKMPLLSAIAERDGLESAAFILLLVGIILVLLCQCCRSAAAPKSSVRETNHLVTMMLTGPVGSGTRLVVQYKVEQGERTFPERVHLHHVVDDEYFGLARLTMIGTQNLWGECSFDDKLNGRDRFPDPVQGEVQAFAEPIADDDMRHMVVDAGAACAQSTSQEDCKNVFLRHSWNGMVTLCSCQVVGVLSQAFVSSFIGCRLSQAADFDKAISVFCGLECRWLNSASGLQRAHSSIHTRGNEYSSLSGDV